MNIRQIGIVAAGIGIVVAAAVTTPPHASASTADAKAKTCAAFKTWEHRKTNANLDSIVTASFGAPWKYAGEDAAGLYSDVRGNAKAKYIASDIRYFKMDCPGT